MHMPPKTGATARSMVWQKFGTPVHLMSQLTMKVHI